MLAAKRAIADYLGIAVTCMLTSPPLRYRRMSKDYEYRVQTSETLIDLVAIRLMLNRLA